MTKKLLFAAITVLLTVLVTNFAACGGGGNSQVAASTLLGQGELIETGRELDLAIIGDGLFTFLDSKDQYVYSRSGRLDVNRTGHLVNTEGWRAAGQVNSSLLPDIVTTMPTFPNIMPARATRRIAIKANLDERSASLSDSTGSNFDAGDARTFTCATATEVFDTVGNRIVLAFYFRKVKANGWAISILANGSSQVQTIGGIAFSENGKITTDHPSTFSIDIAPLLGDGSASTVPIPSVVIDLTEVTQFASSFYVVEVSQDGHDSGTLKSVKVAPNGMVSLSYTNGESQAVGQLLLTRFDLSDRLIRVGTSGFTCVQPCSQPVIAPPGVLLMGVLRSGVLERPR